jgi:hypothetical protein
MDICNRLTSFIEKCFSKNINVENNELDMSRHNNVKLDLDSNLDSNLESNLESDSVCLKKCDKLSCCNKERLISTSTSTSTSTSSSTSSKNEKLIEELTPLDLSDMSKKVDEIIDIIKECEIKYECKSEDAGEPLLNSEIIFL